MKDELKGATPCKKEKEDAEVKVEQNPEAAEKEESSQEKVAKHS
jgi:hypothetical protein